MYDDDDDTEFPYSPEQFLAAYESEHVAPLMGGYVHWLAGEAPPDDTYADATCVDAACPLTVLAHTRPGVLYGDIDGDPSETVCEVLKLSPVVQDAFVIGFDVATRSFGYDRRAVKSDGSSSVAILIHVLNEPELRSAWLAGRKTYIAVKRKYGTILNASED